MRVLLKLYNRVLVFSPAACIIWVKSTAPLGLQKMVFYGSCRSFLDSFFFLLDECTLASWNMSTFHIFGGCWAKRERERYAAFRVILFFGVAPFNDANKYVAARRLVSHWSALHIRPLSVVFPVDLFRFEFTWAILMILENQTDFSIVKISKYFFWYTAIFYTYFYSI